jgi:hypothetical protein
VRLSNQLSHPLGGTPLTGADGAGGVALTDGAALGDGTELGAGDVLVPDDGCGAVWPAVGLVAL